MNGKKMRLKIIILGIIVLIIGISLFIYGNNQYNYYKQKGETDYIEIPNTNNNADAEEQMAFGTTVSYIGIFILLLGGLLIAVGFFLKEK